MVKKLFFTALTITAIFGVGLLIYGQTSKFNSKPVESKSVINSGFNNNMIKTSKGRPFIKNFSPIDYDAEGENFDIVQDKRGIMYFANFTGILEYDGTNWRTILTENINRIKTFVNSKNGKIYAGGRKEFGFLESDLSGKLIFKNIASKIDSNLQNFYEVIKIFDINGEIYFISNNWILKYINDKFTIIVKDQSILNAFQVNNEIFYTEKNSGLRKINNQGNSVLINQGEKFNEELRISFILPLDNQNILIGTEADGLYLFENNNIIKLNSETSNFIKNYGSNCAIPLADELYAVGTQRSGILLLDKNLRIVDVIDESAGLISNYVNSIYLSVDNGLWVGLNNGISRIDYFSPFTYFDKRNGLKGSINDIIRFKDKIYVTTLEGLYYLSESEPYKFEKFSGINAGCWDMSITGNHFLVATSSGIIKIKNNSEFEKISNNFTFIIKNSIINPNLYFAGTINGLEIIELKNNNFIQKKLSDYLKSNSNQPELFDEVRSIQEDSDGLIWCGTSNYGVICFDWKNNSLKRYDNQNGLPSNAGNTVNYVDGKLLVSTVEGVHYFDKFENKFLIAKEFITDSLDPKSNWFNKIYQDNKNRIWATDGSDKNFTQLLSDNNNKGIFYRKDQKRFKPISFFTVKSIFVDEEEGNNNFIIWLGGNDGIIRFQEKQGLINRTNFNTLIREIIVNNEKEIFFGFSGLEKNSKPEMSSLLPEENTITFNYSSTSYEILGKNEYQYILEGFDKVLSEWTTTTKKEYTNLSYGSYKFKVRSKNVYGETSDFAEFDFTIETPWFATIWAYSIYVIFGIAAIFLIIRWRGRKLEHEKQVLEEIVEARTAEIMEQKEEIEVQSLQLFIKNDELEKINGIVQAINNEINFNKLLISILERVKVLKVIDRATALVWDNNVSKFKFKASLGWDINIFDGIALSTEEAEKRYISISKEIFEDIFLAKDFDHYPHLSDEFAKLNELEQPMSFVTILIRIENRIEAFLILENFISKNAFTENDLSLLNNLKEHLVSAFIKTKILEDLQITLNNLKEAQQQLVQSEKLASLGQLTAGIAHEIQNPLNFVNNFSSLSKDLIEELNEEIEKGKDHFSQDDYDNLLDIIGTLNDNIAKINEHGKRAESIVKGMLMHSRGKSGEFQLTDINAMVKEYVNLAYHGMRAQNHEFNTAIISDYDESIGKANIVPQDLSRVILNIVNNSCYAVNEKSIKLKEGYSPKIEISTKKFDDSFQIRIKDNGTGIPQSVIDKIFQPFFTTKPTGKGTGLGLSMSYDIVTQIHRGKLEVSSVPGESTEFVITIPTNLKN